VSTPITRRQAMRFLAPLPTLLLSRVALAKRRGIDASGFVPIGGIDQWIAIQGSDVRNPVILFLHGGPAEAQSPFLKEFIPWEKDFTVVNWDQRGSGRTFGRNGSSTPGMSTPQEALERLCEDAREVAQYARRRLSKRKIILIGQSWGTELGLHVIKRWPELFAAYVATGAVVSWGLSMQAQASWARERATASGDRATLQALDATASLPDTDPKRIQVLRKYRLGPSDLQRVALFEAFASPGGAQRPGDAADWLAGAAFTFPKLAPVEYAFDARELGLDIPVPFFVIQGRDDHIVSFAAAQDYLADVRAPRKAFIAIEGGHWACFTNARAFVAALRQHVRPLAS
jgi:proline iminopeptidase